MKSTTSGAAAPPSKYWNATPKSTAATPTTAPPPTPLKAAAAPVREPLERALRERPDGLIYFTDGYADTPEVKTTVPVLWLITQRGLDVAPVLGAIAGEEGEDEGVMSTYF